MYGCMCGDLECPHCGPLQSAEYEEPPLPEIGDEDERMIAEICKRSGVASFVRFTEDGVQID